MKDQIIIKVSQLKKLVKTSGVKVYVYAPLINDGGFYVEVNKSDFLFQLRNWRDNDITGHNTRVQLSNNNILVN